MLFDFLPQITNAPILIVEDNEVNRRFLEKTLRSRGFVNLLAVDSAEKGLAQLPQFEPELLLLDVMLPGMNGFEACEKIRHDKTYGDLPILIQTAITDPELRVKAFEKGATDFVSKPIYADELCARVKVHLEKRYSMKTLREYKNRIAFELESARQLQQAILPGRYEIDDVQRRCRLDVSSYFQPSSEIGGDFWGMKNLFPHQTAFWMVDFSGHGVAAALNAFRLQAYLKEHSPLASRPGDYISQLNDKLLHLLLRGQFATMFYGIADTAANQLLYACACAPHPILVRGATGKAELLDGAGNPLGIGIHLYPTQITSFHAGDMLVLYSDAFIETPNGAGEYITEQHIMALLEENAGASATDVKQILLDYFKQHAGDALRDDLTIAICLRAPI